MKQSLHAGMGLILLLAAALTAMGVLIPRLSRWERVPVETTAETETADPLSSIRKDALEQLSEAFLALPEEKQDVYADYLTQAQEGIREAAREEAIGRILTSALSVLGEGGGNGEAKEASREVPEEVPRVLTSPDGRSYTPIDSEAEWRTLDNSTRRTFWEHAVPVLQDEGKTIDLICTGSSGSESWSYLLPYQLYLWCEEEGIEATRAEYLAYGEYFADGRETFYIACNDSKSTLLMVTARDGGLLWDFEPSPLTRAEIETLKKLQEAPGDAGEE